MPSHRNWSGKVEYDYMGFGNQTINYPTYDGGAPSNLPTKTFRPSWPA